MKKKKRSHHKKKPTPPARIVRKRAGRVAIVRRRRARSRPPLKPARSKRAKHQRANRRAGQVKRHARKAAAITKATKPRKGTPRDLVTASIGRKGADPLIVQVKVSFKLPPGYTPSAKLVRAAINYRIQNGHDAPGATTAIVRWRNPARKDPSKRGWREGDQEAAWQTLGNALKAWATAA